MEASGEDIDGEFLLYYLEVEDFFIQSSLPINGDRTVSRKHISFTIPDTELNLNFQVLGRNPVWVLDSHSGEIRVFKNSEKGAMRCGDRFCVSAKKPYVFRVKKIDLRFTGIDVLGLNPNKEFGFVVKGHEFDDYPERMIRDIKDWDWFLEEKSKDDSESDELGDSGGGGGGGGGAKRKKKSKRKKKDKGEAGDDAWSGESDDEKVMIGKLEKGKRPKYVTRSKDLKKSFKDDLGSSSSSSKKVIKKDIVDGDEDEEDEETLGAFIVDDKEFEEDNVGDDEEDEETEDDYDSDEEDQEK
ncbi:hypothetical protein Syun_011731 [Stephania yunnanensis]|uniref:FHA domain-containing protein n=1 Tax=Stephania yunnanensis TaxID=152371 RepID=A0AAP0PIS3_9MAGN